MKKHFTELDGIRGILSMLVVLFHLGLNPMVGMITSGFIPHGRYELAVDFFFILSGFVLCHVSKGKAPELRRLIVGRAFRMLPISLLSLALCVVALDAGADPSVLVANAFLIQLFIGLPHLNRVAWSACSEMWIPGLLAVGAWAGREKSTALLWTLLLMAWLSGAVVLGGEIIANQHFSEIARSFIGLSEGFLLCMLFPASSKPQARTSSPFFPMVLLISVGLIMVLGGKHPALVYAFPILSGFTIIGFLRTKSFLSGSVCQFLGARSYAIYMLHWPVLLLFVKYYGQDAMKGNVMLKLSIIAVSLLLADLAHRFVELPFMRYRAKLTLGHG